MTKALRQPEGLDVTRPSPARIYDYMLRGSASLRGRRGGRGAHPDRGAGDQGLRLVQPGVPPAGGGLDRAAGGQAVPRHRLGAADRGEHARGGQEDPPGCPGRLRGQRPDGGAAQPGDPRRVRTGQRALRGPARAGLHPRPPGRARADRPGGADRPADDRGPDVRRRRGGPVEPGGALRATRCGRAATWRCRTSPTTPSRRWRSTGSGACSTTRPSRCTSARRQQVARFFDGLEVVPPYAGAAPALTYSGLWGAEDVQLADSDGSRWLYCAVARKP